MAAKTATSKIAPVVIGSGRGKSTTYISTKVTGPDRTGAYTSEIIQSDNATGAGAKPIGSRDANGNITWNKDASGKIKLNQSKFKKASNNQIESVQKELASTAAEKQGLNASSGKANQDISDGNIDSSQSKPTPKPTDKDGTLSGSDTASETPRESYSKTLCYPVAMKSKLKDNIKIDVIKFNPKGFDGAKSKDRPKGKTIGSVVLPVPTSVQDGNQTSWGQGTMTPAQMAKANVVRSLLSSGGGEKAAGALGDIAGDVSTDGPEVSEALGSFFTEQLTGTEDILARTTGAVANPNMELLFKGPQLRSFSFSWKMSPRDQKESVEIAKIIRMFKQSMAPQKTNAGLFLKAPNIYKLIFNQGTSRHKFLPRMKECALNNCAVNYTPEGSYMTYDNTAMVALEMSLSFQEMEPIYNNDMGERDDNIGY